MNTHDRRGDPETDDFVAGAYSLSGTEEAEAFYRRWADEYDERMVGNLNYCSPRLVAENLMRHLGNPDAEVLDVGCGTGLTSERLHEEGYRRIDGIDLSAAMLARARARGIYRNLIQADLNRPIDLPDRSWDAMVSSGTFTCGHVGPGPFDELVRLLRPGGLMSFSVHAELWESLGFRATLDSLVEHGQLVPMEKTLDRFFEGREPCGWFLVYGRL